MRRFLMKLLPGLVALSLVSAARPAEHPRPDHFPFKAPIEGSADVVGLCRVSLDAGILEQCGADLGHIRVFDAHGSEVPFVILPHVIPARPEKTAPMKLLAYESDEGTARLVLESPREFGPVSAIRIRVADRDFSRTVQIFGGDTTRQWVPLAEGRIYDFSSQVDLRSTRLDIPASGYRYYRLQLGSTGPEPRPDGASITLKYRGLDFNLQSFGPKRLRIDGVTAHGGEGRKRQVVYDSREYAPAPFRVGKDGDSEAVIVGGVPLERLGFRVSDPAFYREVEVFTERRSRGRTKWHLAGRDRIYAVPFAGETARRTEASFQGLGIHDRYRVVVRNGDNPPLAITALEYRWARRELFFMAVTGKGPYRIYFGGSDAERPSYDLGRFVRADNWFRQQARVLTTGSVSGNASWAGPPATGRDTIERWVLYGVIILAVLLLALWWIRLFRREAGERPDHRDSGGSGE